MRQALLVHPLAIGCLVCVLANVAMSADENENKTNVKANTKLFDLDAIRDPATLETTIIKDCEDNP